MSRVVTQNTSMDVKGTRIRVGCRAVSTECMVMWALNTKEVNAVIDVTRFERFRAQGAARGMGWAGWLRGHRSQ